MLVVNQATGKCMYLLLPNLVCPVPSLICRASPSSYLTCGSDVMSGVPSRLHTNWKQQNKKKKLVREAKKTRIRTELNREVHGTIMSPSNAAVNHSTK